MLGDLDKIELIIDMLTYESLPYNFAGRDDEKSIYEGIYKSWYMERAVNSLHDKYKTLSEMVNYLNLLLTEEAERRSGKIQRSLNYFVLGLACITLISVSYDIFYFDSNGVDVWDKFFKGSKLYILTAVIGILGVIFLKKESIKPWLFRTFKNVFFSCEKRED